MVTRSRFPDPAKADASGLVAIGHNLEVATLADAYSHGIFPWFDEKGPKLWWSPDPRMVLFPENFHRSRRLAQRLRQGRFQIEVNSHFREVVEACRSCRDDGTWITDEMVDAYCAMHAVGQAMSFEVWQTGALVGGLYGVQLKNLFFAESMFHRVTDGSKIALSALVDHCMEHDWRMIDCQFHTGHLASLGAVEIPRERYLKFVRK